MNYHRFLGASMLFFWSWMTIGFDMPGKRALLAWFFSMLALFLVFREIQDSAGKGRP